MGAMEENQDGERSPGSCPGSPDASWEPQATAEEVPNSEPATVQMAPCVFCYQMFKASKDVMIYKGTKKTPVWRCKPCHAACTRMEKAVSTKEEKDNLRLLRKNPREFALQVVKFASSQKPGATQRHHVQQYFSEICAHTTANKHQIMRMFDFEGFVEYHVSRRKTPEEATEMWEAEKENSSAKWEKDRIIQLC